MPKHTRRRKHKKSLQPVEEPASKQSQAPSISSIPKIDLDFEIDVATLRQLTCEVQIMSVDALILKNRNRASAQQLYTTLDKKAAELARALQTTTLHLAQHSPAGVELSDTVSKLVAGFI